MGDVVPYTFQFGVIANYRDELLSGLLLTIELSVTSIVLGTVIGTLLASLRSMYGGWVGRVIKFYVEVVRNTPFLVQLFIIFFGLPALGLRVDATVAALVGMTLNLAAYSAEIIRAGIDAVHKSQIEAGQSLGLTPFQIYRHIIIAPAIAKVYPSLCSQFVLMTLASSVCSAISTEELSAVTAQIESTSYRSFEVYVVATLIYLALSVVLRGVFALIGWLAFRRRPTLAPATAIEGA